jgi:hypothetical protein
MSEAVRVVDKYWDRESRDSIARTLHPAITERASAGAARW